MSIPPHEPRVELPSGRDLALILQVLQPELEKVAFLEAQIISTQKLIEELRLIAERGAKSRAMDEIIDKITEIENSLAELGDLQDSLLTKPGEVMGLYDLRSRIRGLELDVSRQENRLEEIERYLDGKIDTLDGKIDTLVAKKGLILAWWEVALGVVAIIASFVLGYLSHLLGWV
jgi:uncharacterized coiled-coil protein SlyX